MYTMKWSNFQQHCGFGFLIRLVLIVYATFHDKLFKVPYTDVDYKVYTDAARYVTLGKSPYNRHTYRYSPLLAFILTPNIFIDPNFGKVLFSIIDIIIVILIKVILSKNYCPNRISKICALLWLYNPMTIVISTRGNSDSLVVVLILLTLYFLEEKYFISGLIYGLSVYFRLYPIIYSLVIYLSLKTENHFIPNRNQLKFLLGFFLSFMTLTCISYLFYGYEFLYTSFFFHLIRKDARHNFSIYFYMLYLLVGESENTIERILRTIPLLILLIIVSFRYANKKQLPFAILILAMVMVTYNSVVTSQYFFWYLSSLPLSIPHIRMSLIKWITLGSIWAMAQGLWLFHAYCLEFLALNTFYSIWFDSMIFFVVNIKVLYDLIVHYNNVLIYSKEK
ncbi:GPI mannosyltransferase 1 [Chelonus insularis]|uniref:GPI mannosyltransferase 1 n=1 Tax=Chelonus insularis TaxID=460826 RepID=UPI00158CCE33|nr:GPI mannosyltransferase 1 [Chelonus insularis]